MTALPPLTPAELADLKAKAKAASPGKWIILNETDFWTTDDKFIACTDLGDVTEFEKNNADHIAAANPETILRLIDMVERRDAALTEIALAGENGLPPDYNSWLQFHERIARMAREALTATEPPK